MKIVNRTFSLCLIICMALAAGGDVPASTLGNGEALKISTADFRDRLMGGFVGQMVGVMYGFPYEFKFQGWTVPEWLMHEWRPDMIRGAVGQDDLYVELTFLETLERHGLDVPIETIGRDFGESKYPLWHANHAARKNIRNNVMPPLSGHPRYNAHADDIDFQIEADLFGMICPGMPRAAQELTWKFGHVMNYGDGVYGGVFMAAMYAAAFFESDREKVVEAGLAAIPVESNYARTISDVLEQYNKDPDDWKAAWELIEEKWVPHVHCPDRHPLYIWRNLGIGANTNGAYVVIGFLYGNGDPIQTIKIATMCGLDADCNPASAMGVLGTMIGFERLPADFKSALPSMAGNKFAYTEYDWEGAVTAMEKMAEEVLLNQGGKIEDTPEGPVWIIPAKKPLTLPLEQWPYQTPAQQVPLP